MLRQACEAHQGATLKSQDSGLLLGRSERDLHRPDVLVVGGGPVGGAKQAGDGAAQPLPRDGTPQDGGRRHRRATDLRGCSSRGKAVTSSSVFKLVDTLLTSLHN